MAAAPGNRERMYRRLQVPPEASAQQIRRAYHRLAHDLHPDANPGDPEASRRFREITEAYELLSRPVRPAHSGSARREAETPTPGVRVQPAASRTADWVVIDRPTVIGPGPIRVGPSSLAAGPARVIPPGKRTDEASPVGTGDPERSILAVRLLGERY